MSKPMMKCGHAANASHQGEPTCVICWPDPKAREIADDAPDLTGRTARCAYWRGGCKSQQPSSTSLAFFEYCGPGSKFAEGTCGNCGLYEEVHHSDHPNAKRCECKKFEPQGDPGYDKYYCGCLGWE